jgi:cyanophycin synthetase
MVLQQTDEGELLALRHGSRTMPLIYAHLIPATLEGRARMNIANALAAAGAAWAAGAHLHDIRQGLRTFSTSFFQAPGRLNEVDVRGFKVIIDYCHNVDGMRRLTEFVDLTMSGSGPVKRGRRAAASAKASTNGNSPPSGRTGRAIGVIGIPGDRRDEDQRDYGFLAAQSFDEIIVREDKNLRGRKPGETAEHVLEGIRAAQIAGARVQKADAVLEELDAARVGMRRAHVGDLVVVCADDSTAVYREAMLLDRGVGAGRAIGDPGELFVPEG